MAVSDSFLTFVLDQLGAVRGLVSKRMFGGIGLYGEGTFFGVIDNDTMFFKVDDTTVLRYKAMKMPPFDPMPEKGPMLGYYQVPIVVLEDPETLLEWAAEAIEVGRTVKKKPARRKPARKSARKPAVRKTPSQKAATKTKSARGKKR
jgi:DNA transformation protein and related proteins